ncbi:transmembrane protein, putative, partial [Bodo saltans]
YHFEPRPLSAHFLHTNSPHTHKYRITAILYSLEFLKSNEERKCVLGNRLSNKPSSGILVCVVFPCFTTSPQKKAISAKQHKTPQLQEENMRVTASEFYTFVMFVFAVLGGVSHILMYHIHHRDMNADAQTISNFNEAVEQRDAAYVSSILAALVTSDVNNNRLSESRLSRITVASVLEKFSSQLLSWDDAAALHNSTARDFFPFFPPLSECVGANHNNASTCVEEFLHDGNSSAMIGVVSHWMKRVVTTSMLTVV